MKWKKKKKKKNLGGNLPEKQSTIVKRSFTSNTKHLSLNFTIPSMNSQQKPFTAFEPLNSSIYERHPFCMDPST